jgi:hypothetical protein
MLEGTTTTPFSPLTSFTASSPPPPPPFPSLPPRFSCHQIHCICLPYHSHTLHPYSFRLPRTLAHFLHDPPGSALYRFPVPLILMTPMQHLCKIFLEERPLLAKTFDSTLWASAFSVRISWSLLWDQMNREQVHARLRWQTPPMTVTSTFQTCLRPSEKPSQSYLASNACDCPTRVRAHSSDIHLDASDHGSQESRPALFHGQTIDPAWILLQNAFLLQRQRPRQRSSFLFTLSATSSLKLGLLSAQGRSG